MAPFIAAFRAGIETLIRPRQITSLDPDYPATFSEPIVTGLLRHQLGYGAVVFSDDMEMKAVSAHFEPGEAAVLALRAGVDVLLFCLDFGKAADAFEALAAAVEREPAPRGHVERSNRRIAALKERHLRSFTGAAEDDLVERLGKLANRKGE